MGAVLSIGSSIAGGIIGSNAFSSANKAAQSYLSNALNFEEGVYNTAQTNLNPWIQGGQEALGGIEQFLGLGSTGGATQAGMSGTGSGALASYNQYTTTPYYTFPLKSMTQTMNQEAAAKGLSSSGGQLANLGQYAANYASSNFMNYVNALNQLSGVGQSSATSLGNIGANVASTVAGTANQQASSAYSSTLGSASSWLQALNQVFGGGQSTGSGSTYGGGTGGTSPASTVLSNLFGNNLFGGSSWPTFSFGPMSS